MKILFFAITILCVTTPLWAQGNTISTNAPRTLSTLPSVGKQSGLPSDKLVESFIQELSDPKKPKESTRFSVSVYMPILSEVEQKKYQGLGKVPYEISIFFRNSLEYEPHKFRSRRIGAKTVHFVIADENENIVNQGATNIDRFNPYRGEVLKPGTYKFFVWVQHGQNTFGSVVDVVLEFPPVAE